MPNLSCKNFFEVSIEKIDVRKILVRKDWENGGNYKGKNDSKIIKIQEDSKIALKMPLAV